MQKINVIKKILAFLRPDWQKIKVEAEAIETRLQKGEAFLGEHRAATHASVTQWLGQIKAFETNTLKTKLQTAKLYQKWQAVPVDYPALIAVPEDFDLYNKDHMQALIDGKCTL